MTAQKKIEVLGPGCTRCKETFRIIQQVVVSAALFFGMLIPLDEARFGARAAHRLRRRHRSAGRALRRRNFAFGATKVASAFRAASRIERIARPVTGVLLILIGIYETLRGFFHVL